MLYCPNYTCQTPNAETHRFCQKCRTPLPHRYLWAVGQAVSYAQPGDLLKDRYLYKHDQIFLDTKPGLLPTELSDIPQMGVSYLRLAPYRIHVPQIYDLVWFGNDKTASPLLLLDHAALQLPHAVPASASNELPTIAGAVQLLPTLAEQWQSAPALRQLHWLWQIAHLWYPLISEQVVSTLLSPQMVRVDGARVCIQELLSDYANGRSLPNLVQLSQTWAQWAAIAQPEVKLALLQLCDRMTKGQIQNTEQLIDELDLLMNQVVQTYQYQIQIATRTDQGPSRQRNEDACYPPNGTVTPSEEPLANQLLIVCDGIGGHQGGDVASHLAIEAILREIRALALDALSPTALMVELEKAIAVANDVISQRNDSERRFDRQRMGTTIVVGLVRGHELYIAHVGDSRAYWIGKTYCHQVTLDDDVASREVRLGYSLYREALTQPGAGSLVQALGMGGSNLLHPTVQRFIVDTDSVFLLCSDGLSDNDRVDEVWESVILPLLNGEAAIVPVSNQLIQIANTQNGHDNVTVGLIRYTVTTASGAVPAAHPTVPRTRAEPVSVSPDAPTQIPAPDPNKTQVVAPRSPVKPDRSSPKLIPLILSILALLGISGVLAYFLSPSLRQIVNPLVGLDSGSEPTAGTTPAEPTEPPVLTTLQPGMFVQVRPIEPSADGSISPILLQANPNLPTAPDAPEQPTPEQPAADAPAPEAIAQGSVPPESVLYVVTRQRQDDEFWVEMQVCSVPETAPTPVPEVLPPPEELPPPIESTPAPTDSAPTDTPVPTLQPGDRGWIPEVLLLPVVTPVSDPAQIELLQRICPGENQNPGSTPVISLSLG